MIEEFSRANLVPSVNRLHFSPKKTFIFSKPVFITMSKKKFEEATTALYMISQPYEEDCGIFSLKDEFDVIISDEDPRKSQYAYFVNVTTPMLPAWKKVGESAVLIVASVNKVSEIDDRYSFDVPVPISQVGNEINGDLEAQHGIDGNHLTEKEWDKLVDTEEYKLAAKQVARKIVSRSLEKFVEGNMGDVCLAFDPVEWADEKIVINDLLDVRNVKGKTFVYVNGAKFDRCSYVMVTSSIHSLHDVNSVDDLVRKSRRRDDMVSTEGLDPLQLYILYGITPRTQLIAHASNIQAWAEHGYDTRLLHSNLSFPLLKKLAKSGDKIAQKVIEKEIINRIYSGSESVIATIIMTVPRMIPAEGMDYIEKNYPQLFKDLVFLVKNR
jgi:hypothetical protein